MCSRYTLADAKPQHEGLPIEVRVIVHDVVEYSRIHEDGEEKLFARLEVEDASGRYTVWWFNDWNDQWWVSRPRVREGYPVIAHLRAVIKLRDDEVSFQVEDLRVFELG